MLQKFKVEMKFPVRIRSENRPMAQVRSRPEIILYYMKSCCDKREVAETEKRLQGRILCQDIVLRSRHRKKTIMVATDS